MGQLRRYIVIVVLVALFPVAHGHAQQTVGNEAKFPGFKQGQEGWGAVIGSPMGGRYQRWLSWNRAVFFDLGYSIDGFVIGDANYSYYLLSEDDRWKINTRVGTVLYNLFLGAGAGYHITTDREERSRLGIRAGAAFEYLFPASNWSFRAEVIPVFYLTGTTAAGLQGGLVFTYYLGKPENLLSAPAKAGGPVVDREMLEGGKDFKVKKRQAPKPTKPEKVEKTEKPAKPAPSKGNSNEIKDTDWNF